MAALDFPNSPTNGQQWVGTNGATYTWDGLTWNVSSVPGTSVAPIAPTAPVQGQLWWRNDPDGNLFISYNDGNSTQWVPAVPSSTPQWVVSGIAISPISTAVTEIKLGQGIVKTQLSVSTGGSLYATVNNPWAPQDLTKASWVWWTDLASDKFAISRRAANAAAAAITDLLMLDATGQLTVGASTTAGKIVLAPQCTLAATVGATTNVDLTCNTDATVLGYNQAGNGYILRLGAGGGNDWVQIIRRVAGTTTLTQIANFDGASNMQIAGPTATKSSGTTWANPSDRRLKDAIEDYPTGLDAILQLQPRTFLYNGKGGSTAGMRGISFIADEVESVMPEMVGSQRAKLQPDDDEDTDLKTLDVSPLLFAFVNAFKELAARVAALEGK